MKKALVFCGGGAKGSYEAGVWQYLNERGLKFDIVTGTSIGALNAAMYAQDTFDKDLEVWNTITLDKIMKDAFKYDEKVSLKYTLKQKQNLMGFLGSYFTKLGGDISPFYELVDKYIIPEKIINSNVLCGIITTKFPQFSGKEVLLNELSPKLLKKYLIASASAFPIFQVCKIGKESYIDGGYADNLPINYAIELGASEIVAIDLSPNITHKEFLNKEYVKYIYPRWSLCGFLKFDKETIEKNFKLGYIDAKKAYGEYLGFRYAFNKFDLDKDYKSYMLEISKVLYYASKNKIMTADKKPLETSVYQTLESAAQDKMTSKEYYIRMAEIAAEIVNMDHYEVYDFNTFISSIKNEVLMIVISKKEITSYENLKTINGKRNHISKMEQKQLLKMALSKGLDILDLAILASARPKVFVAYMLLREYYE